MQTAARSPLEVLGRERVGERERVRRIPPHANLRARGAALASYRLPDCAPIVQAMLAAAHAHHKPEIEPVVCGPSNIGNYFAAHQIDAACGFGVTYENLHAPNERIKLDTIQMTSAVYSSALQSLLAYAAAAPIS
jgi:succinyl-diaminopimelate desuccinylase